MIDRITQYRTKISWIKQLLSINESKELEQVWKKYSILRKLIESVELNINELEIIETKTDGIKTKNYKIRAKKVSNELLKLSRETKDRNCLT